MSIERARPGLEPEPVPGPRAAGERGTPGPGPSYARGDLLAAVRALAPRLRAASDEIEQARTMPEPLVEAMADAGFYRMLLPRALAGGEIDVLTYFDVVEALARADSAAGWSVVISTSSMVSTSSPAACSSAWIPAPRRSDLPGRRDPLPPRTATFSEPLETGEPWARR